jgi:surfeit locus 1 family protein
MTTIIHRTKLTLIGFALTGLFVGLGLWQLQRAEANQAVLNKLMTTMKQPPATLKDINTPQDWRFHLATLTGQFDNSRSFLLDNKTNKHRVGYEVYTPFTPDGSDQTFLVDRGFIPANPDRNVLPTIPAIAKTTTILGMLSLPPLGVTLGKVTDIKTTTWPQRIETLQLNNISQTLNANLFPYVLMLAPQSPYAFDMEWKLTDTTPAQHRLYAAQWFALALTLLLLSLAMNRNTEKKTRKQVK